MSIKSDVLSYRIPRGYMIVCSSCENDADNPQTNIKYGFSKNETQITRDLLNLLAYGKVGSNLYDPGPTELARLEYAVQEIADKHQVELSEAFTWREFLEDYTRGLQGNSESFYTREVTKVQIYYVPFDVEFPNVTDQFAQ